jgi:mannopine transport system substrate-binding protein
MSAVRLASLAALGFLISASTSLATEKEKLVIVTSGGAYLKAMQKHFYEPFTAATGIEVIAVPSGYGDTFPKVKAMSDTGKTEWDIVSPPVDDMYANRQYLEDLGDCSTVPNAIERGIDGTCQQYGVLVDVGGVVMAYDARAFEGQAEKPSSWSDFFDTEKFEGARSMPDIGAPWWNVMVALGADGVEREKLFPLDIDRGLKKLDTIKDDIVWWTSGDQSQQLLRSQEVAMSFMYSGRALTLKKEGLPLEIVWPGSVRDTAVWSVLKDAPNKEAALKFLNFYFTNPENHAAYTAETNNNSSSKEAIDLLPAADRSLQPVAPENWNTFVTVDNAWVEQNKAALGEAWSGWISQ